MLLASGGWGINLRPKPRMSSVWVGRGSVQRLKMLLFVMRRRNAGIGSGMVSWGGGDSVVMEG